MRSEGMRSLGRTTGLVCFALCLVTCALLASVGEYRARHEKLDLEYNQLQSSRAVRSFASPALIHEAAAAGNLSVRILRQDPGEPWVLYTSSSDGDCSWIPVRSPRTIPDCAPGAVFAGDIVIKPTPDGSVVAVGGKELPVSGRLGTVQPSVLDSMVVVAEDVPTTPALQEVLIDGPDVAALLRRVPDLEHYPARSVSLDARDRDHTPTLLLTLASAVAAVAAVAGGSLAAHQTHRVDAVRIMVGTSVQERVRARTVETFGLWLTGGLVVGCAWWVFGTYPAMSWALGSTVLTALIAAASTAARCARLVGRDVHVVVA